MNRVIIKGRLGKDPEVKKFDGGGQVCTITVATDESYKDRNSGQKIEQTEWHTVSFNGKVSEVISKFFTKGMDILVEGKLRTRSWEKDGVKKYMTEIQSNYFEFCGDPKENETSNQSNSQPQQQLSNTNQPNEDIEDDLPF